MRKIEIAVLSSRLSSTVPARDCSRRAQHSGYRFAEQRTEPSYQITWNWNEACPTCPTTRREENFDDLSVDPDLLRIPIRTLIVSRTLSHVANMKQQHVSVLLVISFKDDRGRRGPLVPNGLEVASKETLKSEVRRVPEDYLVGNTTKITGDVDLRRPCFDIVLPTGS